MFRNVISFGGILLLAGATALVTPSPGQAQRHGGAHSGGAHFGGAHFGGAHVHGGNFGGFRGGIYHGGGYHGHYHYGYPYAHYAYGFYRPSYGFYSYPYYGSYGYSYPYYYDYAYPSPYYEPYPYDYYGYVAPYYDGDGSYQTFYPPATATDQSDTSAHLTVNVPADARVWFDDTPTTSTGSVRQFDSPPLTPGSRYSYEVRASWHENGREVTQTQKVAVTAGAHVRVDFPVPPGTAEQASTTKDR